MVADLHKNLNILEKPLLEMLLFKSKMIQTKPFLLFASKYLIGENVWVINWHASIIASLNSKPCLIDGSRAKMQTGILMILAKFMEKVESPPLPKGSDN